MGTFIDRKQLNKDPETDIDQISAVPQWFKFTIDSTDVQVAATIKVITLVTLPIKAWIHAIAWETTIDWKADGWNFDGVERLAIDIGDEDLATKWLDDGRLLYAAGEGSNISDPQDDYIGLTPYMPDSAAVHAIKVVFVATGMAIGEDLADLSAGEQTLWLLLSSMNSGVI